MKLFCPDAPAVNAIPAPATARKLIIQKDYQFHGKDPIHKGSVQASTNYSVIESDLKLCPMGQAYLGSLIKAETKTNHEDKKVPDPSRER